MEISTAMHIKEGPVQLWNHSHLNHSMQRYQVLSSLGSGGFGTVLAALDPQGKEVAIKKIRTWQIKEWMGTDEGVVPLEVACLKRLHWVAGVPKLIDFFEEEEFFCIVMEKPPGTKDLQQLMEENGALSEEAAREVFHQLLLILWNIREAGIVHRDIKPENLLVNPHTLETYLIDFGLASPVRDDPFVCFRGTIQYAPPEWFRNEEYIGEEAEVWSLGVLLYEVLTGMQLFNSVGEILLKKSICFNKGISKDLNRLFRQMLCKNPLSRISLDQIIVSRWIKTGQA
jgi:serine/threonine protein kinase